jgi:NAD(P)-dependent dehydrogenase (short-subunit alcohol dehydrogenase family)
MAQGLAEAGIEGIALLDYQEALGLVAAEKLAEESGIKTLFVRMDVRDTDSVVTAVDQVHKAFGKITTVINAAGIAEFVFFMFLLLT